MDNDKKQELIEAAVELKSLADCIINDTEKTDVQKMCRLFQNQIALDSKTKKLSESINDFILLLDPVEMEKNATEEMPCQR